MPKKEKPFIKLEPTQRERIVCELWTSNPFLNAVEIAKMLNLPETPESAKMIFSISRSDTYKELQSEICRDKFKDLEKNAIQKLGEQIQRGNMKAITYVLDSCGYKAEDVVNVKAQDGIKINITTAED